MTQTTYHRQITPRDRRLQFIGERLGCGSPRFEIEDQGGRRLARAQLPEGLMAVARLHALVAERAPAVWADLPPEQIAGQVIVGIETDLGS